MIKITYNLVTHCSAVDVAIRFVAACGSARSPLSSVIAMLKMPFFSLALPFVIAVTTFAAATFGMPSPTFFSSLVGGARRNVSNGAYRKPKQAMPTNIHSKPMLFTSVPLCNERKRRKKHKCSNKPYQNPLASSAEYHTKIM